MNTAFLILAGALLVVLVWRRFRAHRRHVAELRAWDRECREGILRRAKTKLRSDEEEDYLLKLRAGGKARPASGTSPPADTSGNRFLD